MTEEHLHNSSIIKDVHLQLRKSAAVNGSDLAWNMHCSQNDLLEKYAKAMHDLATQHWSVASDAATRCRIRWIQKQSQNYFFDTNLKSARLKEINLCEKLGLKYEINDKFEGVSDINVLDVGSCYNPFASCDYMKVLSVDLYPAVPSVMKCDFLNVDIGNELDICSNRIIQLRQSSFDLVVFSLLLEYMPSSKQRVECCSRAYSLLNTEGILAIITPDSKHVGANAKIYKNWRYTLALMGFSRIVYEKLPSLHCMIFRKSINPELTKRWAFLHKEPYMNEEINIPQDFHDLSTEDEESNIIVNDESSTIDLFNELPNEYIL